MTDEREQPKPLSAKLNEIASEAPVSTREDITSVGPPSAEERAKAILDELEEHGFEEGLGNWIEAQIRDAERQAEERAHAEVLAAAIALIESIPKGPVMTALPLREQIIHELRSLPPSSSALEKLLREARLDEHREQHTLDRGHQNVGCRRCAELSRPDEGK